MYDLTDNTNESVWIQPYETEDGYRYKFIEPTFTTDGYEQLTHIHWIVKILNLSSWGSSWVVTMDEGGTIC